MQTSTPVAGPEWGGYLYHYGDGRLARIHFDAGAARESAHARHHRCVRVVLALPPDRVRPDGQPAAEAELAALLDRQRRLVDRLTAAGVSCRFVGSLLYDGVLDLVFQAERDDLGRFHRQVREWSEEPSGYRAAVRESDGWEFFDATVRPAPAHPRQPPDRRAIEVLIESGADSGRPHRLDRRAAVPPELFREIAAELGGGEPLAVGPPGHEVLAIRSAAPLDLGRIWDTTGRLARYCADRGTRPAGWETAAAPDTAATGGWPTGPGGQPATNQDNGRARPQRPTAQTGAAPAAPAGRGRLPADLHPPSALRRPPAAAAGPSGAVPAEAPARIPAEPPPTPRPQTQPGPREAASALSQRIPELDGLRGIAILLVVLLHYVVQTYPHPLHRTFPSVWSFLLISWWGVDLFFVISGFLIGGILLDHRSSPSVLKAFYLRRFFRILPLYYVFLALAFTLSPPGEVPWWSYLCFLQNYWSSTGYEPGRAFGPLWSLGVEEHFYLFAPLIVCFLSERHLRRVIVGMVVGSLAVRVVLVATGWASAYEFPLGRLDGIGMGMFGALLLRDPRVLAWLRGNLRVLRLLVIALAMGLFLLAQTAGWPEPLVRWVHNTVLISYLAVFGLALVVSAVVDKESGLARVLRTPFLQTCGFYCYFIYLFHILVSLYVRAFLFSDNWAGISLAITLILAACSWRLLERPLIRFSRRWGYG